MAAPIKLAHIALRTGDVPRLRAWYCTVLEARVVFENDFIAFVSYDDEHHRIAIIDRGTSHTQSAETGQLDHVSFTMDSLSDLLDTYERLGGQGIVPNRAINHGPTTSMYFTDPDGNGVELQIDNFDTAAEAQAFIDSDAFAANPIGVEFDADRMVERFRNGDALSELIKQGSA
ncbi:MAG: biphenyl 2,3-dioxygenase [Actinomycetia bacterium]|nr:biphenyl 2,3-dioxygenase [Actinomycetes bacterium]